MLHLLKRKIGMYFAQKNGTGMRKRVEPYLKHFGGPQDIRRADIGGSTGGG